MTEVLEQVEAAVAAALDLDAAALSGASVLDAVMVVERVRRRLDALDVLLIAAAAERRLDGAYGATSVADLLRQRLRISPREAKARVERAADLGPRRTLVGEPLDPILPATADALAAGALSSAHVQVIAKTLDDLPPDVSLDVSQRVESLLVERAAGEDPVRLATTGQAVLARLDPDGREPAEERAYRRRGLTLARRGDGTGHLCGDFTAETTAVWTAVLNALSAPSPAADGITDERSAAQRRHDGLHEAGMRLLRAGTLPETGGTPVTVLVHADLNDLTDPDALVSTDHDQPLSVRQLLRLCGESLLLPHVFGPDGTILAKGRTLRLATTAQRRALAARDHGCCFPGCTRPAAWTEVHHVISWQHGGPTNITNLVLLCAHHHRSFQTSGWTITMRNGLPWWLPPPWLDPEQQWIRNTAHHPPDIHFDVGEARATG